MRYIKNSLPSPLIAYSLCTSKQGRNRCPWLPGEMVVRMRDVLATVRWCYSVSPWFFCFLFFQLNVTLEITFKQHTSKRRAKRETNLKNCLVEQFSKIPVEIPLNCLQFLPSLPPPSPSPPSPLYLLSYSNLPYVSLFVVSS